MNIKNWLLLYLISFVTPALHAAPIVYFDFDGDGLQDVSTTAALGSSLTASVYVSNVDNFGGGLISWGTEINFDSLILSASSYTLASSWPLAGIDNNIDNTTATIELLGSSFSAQTGTLKLADIFFDTSSAGSAAISLNQLFPDNNTFSGFTLADGTDLDADINFSLANATINVSAVPLPASLILFMSGLIGFLGFIKKKK